MNPGINYGLLEFQLGDSEKLINALSPNGSY